MSRRNLFWLLGIAAVSLFGMAVSYSAPTREKDRDYELVRLVVDVLHEVRKQYVVDVSPDRERQLVEDMINGGLERLDPHSGFINARDYKQFDSRSEGKFGGVGIHVGFDPDNRGLLTVVSPIPGTPAYEAGGLAGDVVRQIDGKPTGSLLMSEGGERIQGEPGPKGKLTPARQGVKEPLDFTLTRAIIKVQSALGDQRKPDTKEWDFFLDKKERIAYVRLVQFTKTTAQELKVVLEGLEKDEVRGLVL